jgi:putative flippase GtrA
MGEMRGQLGRFLIVGLGNTVFSYAVYALGLFMGLPYWLASLVALVIGIAVGFVMQGRLVFRSSLEGRLPVFVAVWAALYGVNILVIRLLTNLGIDAYLAGAMATVPTVALSFALNRLVVFRGSR